MIDSMLGFGFTDDSTVVVDDDVRAELRNQLCNHVGVETPERNYQQVDRVEIFRKEI